MFAGGMWLDTSSAKIVICSVQVRPVPIVKLEIDIQSYRYTALVAQPVRGINGNVHAGSGTHLINDRSGFIFRLIPRGAVVSGSIDFKFLIRDKVFICTVEEMNFLIAMKLKYPRNLPIQVILRYPIR